MKQERIKIKKGYGQIEQSDSMYKYLVSNNKKDGYIHRVYDNGIVALHCSIKELDATKDPHCNESAVSWDSVFVVRDKAMPIAFSGKWDKMVDKFERLTLDAKSGEREMQFGAGGD